MLALKGLLALVPSFAWRYLAIAGLLGSVYLFIDTRAANREKAKCEAAAQVAVEMARKQDATAAENARKNDALVISQLSQQKDKDDAELQRLAGELKKRTPAARCDLTEPDARRLRY